MNFTSGMERDLAFLKLERLGNVVHRQWGNDAEFHLKGVWDPRHPDRAPVLLQTVAPTGKELLIEAKVILWPAGDKQEEVCLQFFDVGSPKLNGSELHSTWQNAIGDFLGELIKLAPDRDGTDKIGVELAKYR